MNILFKFFLLFIPLILGAASPSPLSINELPFFTYKPMYIGTTTSDSDNNRSGELKYQFSFKVSLLEDSNLFFGYSQKVIWSMQHPSSPVKEINYNPEVFYIQELENDWIPWIQWGIYNHESNGLDGNASREWDTSYVEPFLVLDDFTLSYKYWIPFPKKISTDSVTETAKIMDYYGNGQLKLRYNPASGNTHTIYFRKGKLAHTYATKYQLNLSINSLFNEKSEDGILSTSIFFEYFSGYGETLSTYDKDTSRFLIGISLNK